MSDWYHADPVAPQAPSSNWWDADPVAEPSTTLDVAKSIGSGLIEGAKGAVAGVPLSIDLLSRGVEAAAKYLAPQSEFTKSLEEGRRQAEENRRVIREAVGPHFYEHVPETTAGEYAKTGAEFLPSAMGGPGGIGRRILTQALPAAALSETGGQVFKGTPLETPARIGGALVGGTAGGLVSVPRTTERALSSRLPSYVTSENIDRAETLINEAKQRNITLTWPEALSRVTGKPVLTDMQRLLESSAETRGAMGDVLAHRPEQFDRAALEEFGKIAPDTATPSMIGREVQGTAKGTLDDVRQIINLHTDPYYKAAEAVKIKPEDMKVVETTPGYKELRDEIRSDPHLNSTVAHLPDDSVGFLNEVKKLYDQRARNLSLKGPEQNQQRAASYSSGAQTMKGAALNASPDYEVALNTQAQTRKQYLDPLMAGPLGKLAKTPETQRAIDALFPQGPLSGSHNEVFTAVSALAKRNPWAATQLVRAHLQGAFDTATQRLVGGPNEFGAAKWVKAITGNPQQRDNLKAAVEALPDGTARWKGLENFLNIAEATGERQPIGSRTAFNTQDLAAMASGGKAMGLIKTAFDPSEWLHFVKDRISEWQAGRNMESLARIITDPRAGDTFRKIATAKGKREAQLLATRLIAQTATGGRAQQQ
jgi:hypothetical protein